MYPKIEPQIKVMKDLLKESRLSPEDITFLEASGVALRDPDADELEAIDAVYGKRKKPLIIGSVKSNVGDAVCVNAANAIVKVCN